ncbi:MAG: ATP-dependent zinc protease [Lunatimonas sp.]|uniref:ATP-dependent zinc protease family protein n=1 Tax=Lunatimonas sp. TaxID=2060141 RepID=UPI00263BA5CE|nr:RimK/LysX family protein [Lunatimonas sp.]MCC5939686.1 ATP-dependent zinc protease [Lunatimonas sp.]
MKRVIGRREKISLPEWGISGISGKVDTGAYTSSIHSVFSEMVEVDGNRRLRFTVLDPKNPKYTGKILETEHFSVKSVKNSFGQAENRYHVLTTIELFGEKFEAAFTLSDRSKMRNQVLLGRKLLRGRFVVDVDLINQSLKALKTSQNKNQ